MWNTTGEQKNFYLTFQIADRLGIPTTVMGLECPFCLKQEVFMKKVAIIMGSSSDLPVVRKAAAALEEFGVPYEMHIFSAHRTPEQARSFAISASAPSLPQPVWRRTWRALWLPRLPCP